MFISYNYSEMLPPINTLIYVQWTDELPGWYKASDISFIFKSLFQHFHNSHRWNIQCDAKCALCNSSWPTTAHVLSGCPVPLSQHRYTYHHDSVLHTFLITRLIDIFVDFPSVKVYADLQNFWSGESPPATIPTAIMVTAYQPDIVIHRLIPPLWHCLSWHALRILIII